METPFLERWNRIIRFHKCDREVVFKLVQREHLEVQIADAFYYSVFFNGEKPIYKELLGIRNEGRQEQVVCQDVIDQTLLVEGSEVAYDDS